MDIVFSEELKNEIQLFAAEIKPKYKDGDVTGLDILFCVMEYLNLVERQKGLNFNYKQRLQFYYSIIQELRKN